jgi:hypothetical protein
MFLQAFIACTRDTNDETLPLIAVGAIGKLRAVPDLSVPALIACLQSTNAMLRMSAADVLAAFESQATNGIPALTNALADPDPEGSERAMAALHEIAPATFTNVPAPRRWIERLLVSCLRIFFIRFAEMKLSISFYSGLFAAEYSDDEQSLPPFGGINERGRLNACRGCGKPVRAIARDVIQCPQFPGA